MKLFQLVNERSSLIRAWKSFASSPLFLFALFLLGTASLQATDNPRITNERTGVHYISLQAAIDDAASDDTLKIHGTCFGPFFIDKNLTLIGSDDAILDGNKTVRVLNIGSLYTGVAELTVILENLTIQNGLASEGGGILNAGDLTLKKCEVIYNSSTGSGGGISNFNINSITSSGCLQLFNTEIIHNTAFGFGGGLISTGGQLTFRNAKIEYNTSGGVGGGVYSSGDTDNLISNSEFKGNLCSGGVGGGWGSAASVTVFDNTEFELNVAGIGGGIFNQISSITLNNCKVNKNKGAAGGGGIYNTNGGSVILNESEVRKNIAVTGTGGGILSINATTLQVNDSEVEHNTPNDIVEMSLAG